MKRIIGVIPAGGKARRIHGFFKEMMPIGINEQDKSKFVVSSERIAGSMFQGGAASVHIILSGQKGFISDYYGTHQLFTGKINFNQLTQEVEELGMPYTIDTIFHQTIHFDYVLMGMPDTVIDPTSSFQTVLTLITQHKADLALGLYFTDQRNRGGFIEFNEESKEVLSHVDKTSNDFPANADNSWAIACWSKKFTQYMHDFLLKKTPGTNRLADSEVLFGNVIDAAVKKNSSLKVVADYVDKEGGFYWDITEPEKYFDLLRHYSPAESSSRSPWQFLPAGSQHDGFIAIREIISSTKKELLIADNYVDKELWKLLSILKPGTSIRILTKRVPGDFELEARTFSQQYGMVVGVTTTDSLHDRFIVCDLERVWHVGASINHLGVRAAVISEITGRDIAQAVSKVLEALWQQGESKIEIDPVKRPRA